MAVAPRSPLLAALLLSAIRYPLSAARCTLPSAGSLQSAIRSLLPAAFCRLSAIRSLLPAAFCRLSAVCYPLSAIRSSALCCPLHYNTPVIALAKTAMSIANWLFCIGFVGSLIVVLISFVEDLTQLGGKD